MADTEPEPTPAAPAVEDVVPSEPVVETTVPDLASSLQATPALPPEAPQSEGVEPETPLVKGVGGDPGSTAKAGYGAGTSRVPEEASLVPVSEPPVNQTSSSPATSIINDLLIKARAMIQTRRRKKLQRIVEFVTTHGSITNDQVEKLLHVSDATARWYLETLVKEGRLKRIGTTGRAVRYEKF